MEVGLSTGDGVMSKFPTAHQRKQQLRDLDLSSC